MVEIAPPRRAKGVVIDFQGFGRERMVKILLGFVAGHSIPPITVHELPEGPHRYGLREGFHRFYASAAAGFNWAPVTVVDYFVW
jgi:hypothetical protein